MRSIDTRKGLQALQRRTAVAAKMKEKFIENCRKQGNATTSFQKNSRTVN